MSPLGNATVFQREEGFSFVVDSESNEDVADAEHAVLLSVNKPARSTLPSYHSQTFYRLTQHLPVRSLPMNEPENTSFICYCVFIHSAKLTTVVYSTCVKKEAQTPDAL